MADKILKSITFPDLADRYVIPTDAEDFTYEGENLKEVLDNKANTDGYYEGMTAGTADQLNSSIRENDKTPYVFRTSGGSVDIGDREYVNGIVGGTVAWNQLAKFSSGTVTENGVTSVWDATNGTITLSGTPTGPSDAYANFAGAFIPAEHKVLIMGCPSGGSANTYYLRNGYIASPTYFDIGNGSIINMNANGLILQWVLRVGTTVDNLVFKPQAFDLTQMFGSTIADYIYSLEQANAGAGVAWFKKLFPKPYYEYNAGELKSVEGLVSHDMTGFNAWDEEWELGALDTTTGATYYIATQIRSKNYIPVIAEANYYVKANPYIWMLFYDADKNVITADLPNTGGAASNARGAGNQTLKMPKNCAFVRFYCQASYGTTYNHDICINIAWDNSRNGEYEPYVKHSYPLDSTVVLHGIFKLDANGRLYCDGDIYKPSGEVQRRYRLITGASFTLHNTSSAGYKTYKFLSANTEYVAKVGYNLRSNLTSNVVDSINSGSVSTACIQQVTSGDTLRTIFVSIPPTADIASLELIYELATPTTETADPYNGVQIVNDFGTEEYVFGDTAFPIPVGHDTDYPVNLKAKLEMAPDSPSGDGDYIVRQTNGTNAYVPLIIEDALPTIPSTAGSYKLVVTVADGSDPVLSWESEV